MIRRIQHIKAFGVFSDFEWPAALPEFKRYNLLYGWNYSGKTTLSRAIRCLEQGKHHPDFAKAEVKINMEGGATHELATPGNVPTIRVFNTDFVRENLTFDVGDAAPILVLGAGEVAKQKTLTEKKAERDELTAVRAAKEKLRTDTRTGLDKALTKDARDLIKNGLARPDYNRTKFDPKVAECAHDPTTHVLDDSKVAETIVVYRSADKKPALSPKVSGFSSIPPLRQACEGLFDRVVGTSKRIARLMDNADVESWVNQGRLLHAGKDNCQFCGQSLPANLLEHLVQHFTAEHEKLMNELAAMEKTLTQAKKEFIELDAKTAFYPELADRYASAKSKLDKATKDRAAKIEELLQGVQAKAKKPFTAQQCPVIQESEEEIDNALADLNKVIDDHNNRTALFETKKQEAFDTLERHYAATFAIEQEYAKKTELIETLGPEIESQRQKLVALDLEIRDLEKEISEASKGAERINKLLGTYFQKDDLRIVVNPDKRFEIMRGKHTAKNLSEGEKTAIAFAYFVTRIQDGQVPLANTIVVVDDPVSSLDAGHLFNTYALIKTQLADCRQLFVSTHSFEFYDLLKDWAKDDKYKDWSIFLLKRNDGGIATLQEIPPALLKFKSEYHYLFSILYGFQQSADDGFEMTLNLPNIVRRFMEAFGGVMIPVSKRLQQKMERLFPDEVVRERVSKYINNYSHNASQTRSLSMPDMSECKAVVAACLECVKNWDADYFDDLKTEVAQTR